MFLLNSFEVYASFFFLIKNFEMLTVDKKGYSGSATLVPLTKKCFVINLNAYLNGLAMSPKRSGIHQLTGLIGQNIDLSSSVHHIIHSHDIHIYANRIFWCLV